MIKSNNSVVRCLCLTLQTASSEEAVWREGETTLSIVSSHLEKNGQFHYDGVC